MFTKGFVFINLGATIRMPSHLILKYLYNDEMAVIIIVLLAMTPRSEMHPANYVFGSAGVVNQTGGWNTGLSFLFGLLSVQWTVRAWLNFIRSMNLCPDFSCFSDDSEHDLLKI